MFKPRCFVTLRSSLVMLTALFNLVAHPAAAQLPTITANGDGSYTATIPSHNYIAKINTQGILTSFRVGGNPPQNFYSELFYRGVVNGVANPDPFPLLFTDNQNTHTLASSLTPVASHTIVSGPTLGTNSVISSQNPNGNDPTLTVTVQEAHPTYSIQTTIVYEATATGLLVTIKPQGYGMWLAWRLADSTAASNFQGVIAMQEQQRAPLDYVHRLPGNGTIHALPLPANFGTPGVGARTILPSLYGVRDMRYYLSNQTALDVYYTGYDSADLANEGELFAMPENDYTSWGRFFGSAPVQFYFLPVLSGGTVVQQLPPNPTPSFRLIYAPQSGDTGNGYGTFLGNAVQEGMFAKGNTLRYFLEFRPDAPSSNQTFTATYLITDCFNVAVSSGTTPPIHSSDLTSVYDGQNNLLYKYYPLTLSLPVTATYNLTGWFHLKVALAPYPTPTTSFLQNADDAEFGIYNYNPNGAYLHPALANAPTEASYIPLLASSDPGIPQLFGMRAVRIAAGYQDANSVLATPGPNDPSPYHETTPPNSPYLNPNDTLFVSEYIKLHSFSAPSSTGSPDANAMLLFGSIIQKVDNPQNISGSRHETTVFYNDVKNAAKPYAQPLPPETDYDYTHGIATVFNTDTLATPFRYWSLTNEPENQTRYQSTSDVTNYVHDVLAYGYHGIQDAYAGTGITPVVIGPNLSRVEFPTTGNDAYSWMQSFLDATGNDPVTFQPYYSGAHFVDSIGLHTYTGNERSWEEHGTAESLQTIRSMMDARVNGVVKYPDAHKSDGTLKDLWITEQGWTFGSHIDKPNLQAAYLVRRYALAATQGIPHEHNAYYYSPQAGYLDYYLWNGGNLAPQRGGMAMRVLAEQTQSQTFYRDLLAGYPNAKYVHAIDYTDGVADTIVVWGNDFYDPRYVPSGQTLTTLTLTSSQPLNILDIMGNDITAGYTQSTSPYVYTVPATGSPVYVKVSHTAVAGLQWSGWPLLVNETNYASASGSTASTTASAPVGYVGYNSGGAEVINDTRWQYDDANTRNKKVWISNTLPTAANPAVVTVNFNRTCKIDTIVAVVPSSNGHMCGARDYDLQYLPSIDPGPPTPDSAKTHTSNASVGQVPSPWVTVKSVRGNTTEWVLAANFAPVNAQAVRLVIYDINNGSWLEDKNPLIPNLADPIGTSYANSVLRAMVYELEAYGTANQ